MRVPFILAGLLVLSGCASVEQLREQAPYQSELTLCEKAILAQGPISMVAREELNRRGANCNSHMGAIAAMQANNAQQMQLGVQLLQAAQPQPMYPMLMPAQSVFCTSRPDSFGNVRTVCQ